MEQGILIRKIEHEWVVKIGVVVPYQNDYIEKIKQIAGRQWDRSQRCWLVPYSKEAYAQLKELFPNQLLVEDQQAGLTP